MVGEVAPTMWCTFRAQRAKGVRTSAWLSSALRSRLDAGSAVAVGRTIILYMQLPAGSLSAATSEALIAPSVASIVEERSWGKDSLRLQELG